MTGEPVGSGGFVGRISRVRTAIVVAVAVVGVGIVGAGVAAADVGFSVPSPNGLTDGQLVAISLSGINVTPFSSFQVSECGNAFADNSALPTFNAATDCQPFAAIPATTSTTVDTSVQVIERGLGIGNRSCSLEGTFACTLRVTAMTNQLTSPLPPPVAIAFAADAAGAAAFTSAVVSVTGAPVALGKTATVHLAVTAGTFIVDGTATVAVDGSPVATSPLTNGVLDLPVPGLTQGPHTVDAQYAGTGSFAAATAVTFPFQVISTSNIGVGDTTVIEGNAPGMSKVAIPIVLSKRPTAPLTVNYAFSDGTATLGSDYLPNMVSGSLVFSKNLMFHSVFVPIIGDNVAEPNETFHLDISTTTAGWDIRRGRGTVTIIDDDATPGPPAVGIGSASTTEGDFGAPHLIALPITLSSAQSASVKITVVLSSVNSRHRTPRTPGDWASPIRLTFLFKPGQLRKNVGIVIFPDTTDEPDLMVQAQITSIVSTTGVVIGHDTGLATILSDE